MTPGEGGCWSGPRGSSKQGRGGGGVSQSLLCVCEAREQGPALMNRSGLAEDLF